MGAQLLQVEDDGGQRRDVGAQASSGKGALRVVAPDAESTLSQIKEAQDVQTTSLGAKLDALLTELQEKLSASDLQFVLGALKVHLENLPSDFPDAQAQSVLSQILTKLNGTLTFATSEDFVVSDGVSHTKLDTVATKLDTVHADLDTVETKLAGIETNTTGVSTEATLATRATEATLESVRAAVDGVEAKLDSLLTELAQKTEPADNQNVKINADGTAYLGYVSPSMARKVGEGKVYFAGGRTESGSLGTEHSYFVIENPATFNGVTNTTAVTIVKVLISSNGSGVRLRLSKQTPGNLTSVTPENALVGYATAPSRALPSYGISSTQISAFLPFEAIIHGGNPIELELPPILIAPNNRLTIYSLIPVSTQLSVTALWYEG